MIFYPPKINQRFENLRNAGKIGDSNAIGTGATFICGSVLRINLLIDIQTKEIIAAKFQTNGCGYVIAATDFLLEMIIGKNLTKLHGLDSFRTEIENEFGKFDEHRKHCLNLCLEALQSAFTDFRSAQIEEWAGEKALVCTCFGVSEDTVEKLIIEQNLETVEEVSQACNAGSGCGSCQFLIQEIIDTSLQNF